MARLAAAFGSSHSVMLTAQLDDWLGHFGETDPRMPYRGTGLPIVPIFLSTYNPPNQPLPRRTARARRRLTGGPPDRPPCVGRAEPLRRRGGPGPRGDRCSAPQGPRAARAHRDPRRLKAGSSEIRSWIVVAAAAVDLDLTWISYTPAYRTPALTGTGLAFARWN